MQATQSAAYAERRGQESICSATRSKKSRPPTRRPLCTNGEMVEPVSSGSSASLAGPDANRADSYNAGGNDLQARESRSVRIPR